MPWPPVSLLWHPWRLGTQFENHGLNHDPLSGAGHTAPQTRMRFLLKGKKEEWQLFRKPTISASVCPRLCTLSEQRSYLFIQLFYVQHSFWYLENSVYIYFMNRRNKDYLVKGIQLILLTIMPDYRKFVAYMISFYVSSRAWTTPSSPLTGRVPQLFGEFQMTERCWWDE